MLPKSLYYLVNESKFEDFSANILTLKISKKYSNAFTEDLKAQFAELLAQNLGRKIRIEVISDENAPAVKVAKDKISNRQFLEDILNINKNGEEFSGAEDFDIEISDDEISDSEEEADFLKYTLKIFETTNFEKIEDEE